VISRKDIKRMYVSNLSAMPADLEKQIDLKQMADRRCKSGCWCRRRGSNPHDQ
jgi:hypothetical protein